MSRLSIVLYCGAALGLAGQGLAQAQAQAQAQTQSQLQSANAPGSEAPLTVTPRTEKEIIVSGRRLPGAEAPRSATCEVLARDGYFQELLRVTAGDLPMRLPTRAPRNPNYSAAPLTPVGSPLPVLTGPRFGVGERPTQGNSNPTQMFEQMAGIPATQGRPDQPEDGSFTLSQAIDTCREAYARGGSPIQGRSASGADAAGPLADMNTRFNSARAFIAGNDKTLPMAFALFDQNRFAESLEWFEKAARKLAMEEGGDEAALFVGKLYLQGLGERSDAVKGVEWLKKAAWAPFNPAKQTAVWDASRPDHNTAMGEAAVILGNIYRTGFAAVPKDLEQSRRYFARALETGHIPAAKTLGDIYADGLGTPRDAKKAESYYRKAAKMGVPSAQIALADMLYLGDTGVKQDLKEALQWYQAAAKSDHPDALFALARAYDFGEGVRADQQLAIGFYKSAALKGSAAAKTAVGTYFKEGKVVARSDATARAWFERAAGEADPDGMFNLAAMMVRGEGGERDLVSAWLWLKEADARGHDNARPALAAVQQRMTPEQLKAAAALSKR